MIGLPDLYRNILKKPLPTQCGITCEEITPELAKLNRLLTESLSYFSYTLVLKGCAEVMCNDKIININKNDILITTPGMNIKTIDVSDDFSALCLMGDEKTTYEIPFARNVVSASYFTGKANEENKLSLRDCEPEWMERRMREISAYITGKHIYKKECLHSVYSLFILDLLNVVAESRKTAISPHVADLFLRFAKLLTENYLSQHEISFYAGKLAVTPIYLSRVVKSVSGQTVKSHVSRLLLMEASYLLISSDMPVTQISEKLNFSNPSGFCRFFLKHKGLSPREYRRAYLSDDRLPDQDVI